MAHAINRLSVKGVAAAGPGRYADGRGLYLVVDEHGKRWMFMFKRHGKRREMGLGSVQDYTLAQARERALEARRIVLAGGDPIEQRRASRAAPASAAPSLGEFAMTVIDSLAKGWTGAHTKASWKRVFELYAFEIYDTPVDQVDTDAVLRVLRPIWTAKPETAGKVRERLEKVLDAAKAKGLRSGENPAMWRGHLSHLLSKRAKLSRGHFAAMPYADVPAFVKALRQREAMTARALEWTILTVARENMTLGAEWREIEGDVWTVPAGRMKGRKPFRVPVSAPMKALLERMEVGGKKGLIFPGLKPGRPLSGAAMDKLVKPLGFTVHGFRSSFKDWAHDATEFPRELIEIALAHVVGDETERAYWRSDALDKRRALMEAWGAFVTQPPQ